MANTRELIRELHDKRNALREQQKAVFADMEGHVDDDGNGERQAKFDQIDKDITSYGERIRSLQTILENEQKAAEDREKFALVLQTERSLVDQEQSIETQMRNWLRAGLPDAEVWAPKAITIHTGKAGLPVIMNSGLEKHDLTKGTATDGAELIPTGFVRRLYEHMLEANGIRRTNAEVLRTSSGENLLVPATTTHGTATLVAEAGPFLENDPQFKQVTVGAYKFGQLIQVSTELVQDTAVDLLAYLARAVGIAIGVAQEGYFVTGTGTAQPEGIANSPTAGVTGATGSTTSVTANNLIDLYHSINSPYRANAFWIMNDSTAAFIRKIRDDSGGAGVGNFIWQPGLTAGAPDTLLGRPVVTSASMPVMAANAYSIAFGDFSLYFVIRDVNTIRFERSDDFAFANDLVTFRSALRTDSRQLVNGSAGAVKFYRNSAT